MGAKILVESEDEATESPKMVESSAFEFQNMERYLESGRFTDLKIICGRHTFRVHRLIVTANCPRFENLFSKGSKKTDDTYLDDDEDPAMIARLIYFLYTGSYPSTHINRLKVKSFSKLSDDCVTSGRLSLLHASMFSVGIDYLVPELRNAAALAFRSLNQKRLYQDPNWPDLIEHIYGSTSSHHRDLRNIVVRELLYATHHDRARFKMQDLKEATKTTPELAVDLATFTLTNQMFRCNECDHDQYLLVFPCLHKKEHETYDSDCFKLGLENQECAECHQLDVFT